MTWKAEDKNLHPTPISLEWSATKDGPWEFIGGPRSRHGRYAWQITERMPPEVFLRLTVCDMAGNVTVAQTADPVLIDLTEPEIANVGVATGRGCPSRKGDPASGGAGPSECGVASRGSRGPPLAGSPTSPAGSEEVVTPGPDTVRPGLGTERVWRKRPKPG